MTEEHSVLFSDDDDDSENGYQTPEMQGVLSKWTNYIHGWQSRFIVLKDGTLSYYKSEQDTGFGCRGAISLFKATIKPHEFDECRFDVSVNDCVWYLRADTPEDKQQWVDVLETYKAESGYGSENNLKRHGSAISLTSNTLSTASTSSFKKGRGLKEKLAEMETFRDILCQQIETLQKYFDACAEISSSLKSSKGSDDASSEILKDLHENSVEEFHNNFTKDLSASLESSISKDLILRHGDHAIDFKGEALTFKATTAGIIATLQHCLEVVGQREDMWRRRMEKEMERRRKVEELYRQAKQEAASTRVVVHSSPDFEEGPHSTLNEEEFYDAVETGLDKIEEDVEFRERMKSKQSVKAPLSKATQHKLWPEASIKYSYLMINKIKVALTFINQRLLFLEQCLEDSRVGGIGVLMYWCILFAYHQRNLPKSLWEVPIIDRITMEQLHYARLGVGEGGWQLFAEEGEMKMYRREEESEGLVIDPLKACHVVKGVTGHEMCHYFFSPDVRMEWETTLEQMTILETVADDTLVFLQVHKRIWPASQRDALFWSHMRKVPDDKDRDGHDIWIANIGKCVRVYLTICLVCQTFIDPPKEGSQITRDNITCKITYCSVVNPGGWAPASVLRAVYKREYPKFLKRFTAYVIDQCKDKPILF
ncbi:Collagen type IV alpha-3-binding protein [Gryllus bimaculatus]|nr:Collagen type IV alpha-3-binding protein [Gryllus bimaculatus]